MNTVRIGERYIGEKLPVYIIAEMSANHMQDFNRAVQIIEAAKAAGADAVKIQTYTPDTLTINCHNINFQIKGTIWEGRNLYDLYGEAYMPWEWQPRLKEVADDLNLDVISTAYDITSVDFLEKMEVPAYKIASFELVDLPLLRYVAATGKPIILSTGMATLAEIEEALKTIRGSGGKDIILLKCTSAYPAPSEEMNLRTIPHMAEAFRVPTGLSDHTLGIAVPVAAVALGACLVEKHFTLSRSFPGPDSTFSLEPHEFETMVESIRIAERALGRVRYEVTEQESVSKVFRRSLFVVQDMNPGEIFTEKNVRSIRPGYGLHTRFLREVLGRKAAHKIRRGTPLAWKLVS
jgi:N-acetylneuraminate synthase